MVSIAGCGKKEMRRKKNPPPMLFAFEFENIILETKLEQAQVVLTHCCKQLMEAMIQDMERSLLPPKIDI